MKNKAKPKWVPLDSKLKKIKISVFLVNSILCLYRDVF